MIVAIITIKLHASWVHSLKEKRMEVKSLLAKVRNQFNVSAVESDKQDVHQIIVLTVAALAADSAQADSILGNIENFVESRTEAELVSVEREFL